MSHTSDRSGVFAPPWERLVSLTSRASVWLLLFATIYLLRSFFLLIFLTFVFSYVQAHAVERLAGHISNRTLRVVVVGVIFLGVLIAIGAFLVPSVREQAVLFANNYGNYLRTFDQQLYDLAKQYPIVQSLFPELAQAAYDQGAQPGIGRSPTATLLQQLLGLGEMESGGESIHNALEVLRNIGAYLVGIGSAFLLSLLFSFLIVLDLPRLSESVRSLANTKVRFIYLEVADTIYDFARVLGRALEAQFFIALLNTVLTALGLWVLGLTSKMAFLSVIVFLCSFIPIAGVFISSVPICLLALQEAGVVLMLLAIAMITAIHLIEAYVLNPRIFGHHLRLNPVLVLIILTIGGKLFHVWGLVLGLPICTYIFKHAIQRKAARDS